MEQYISKSAIVAEIERRIDKNNERAASYSSSSEHDYLCRVKEKVYKKLLSFLNTLDTKEVDIEKECKTYIKNNFTSKEAPDEFLTTQMQLDDMVLFARHFYELGLNAQSDKELVEEIYSHL